MHDPSPVAETTAAQPDYLDILRECGAGLRSAIYEDSGACDWAVAEIDRLREEVASLRLTLGATSSSPADIQ